MLPDRKHLSVVPDLEQELDRLYGLPLEEFTQARNDLTTRLTKAGQAEAADEVKRLGKPTVPIWAINQAARREPADVRGLVDAAQKLREAQARGGGDVRAQSVAERKAVQALVDAARAVLEEDERPATDATVQRIGQTLRAAAADEQAAKLLTRGRLTEELEPGGFDVFAGVEVKPRRRDAARAERAADEARETAERARAEADAAAQALAEAEDELERSR